MGWKSFNDNIFHFLLKEFYIKPTQIFSDNINLFFCSFFALSFKFASSPRVAGNFYLPETKLRLAIKLWSDMRNFVSFFLFAITVVFSNLLLSKITINLHLFTYTRLKIYTPYSAFSSIFHFRSLYPNRYNTSCNIIHILHYLRPFQVLSVAKQLMLSLYC